MSTTVTVPDVGRTIRAQREQRGISLRELASRIEVSPATLSGIETGNTTLSVERMCRIADELQLLPHRLLDEVLEGPAGRAEAGQEEHPPYERDDLPGRAQGRWREFPELPLDPALSGALIAFCDKGFHGASIREIADHAGLSVSGLYHYQPGKDAMLPALLDLTMADLTWRLDVARAEVGPGAERLHRTVECLALFHARRPRLAFLGASEMRSLSAGDRARITAERKRVQRILQGDIRSVLGQIPSTGRLMVTLGNAISTMCTSLSQWIHHDGSIAPELIASDYADAAVAMVSAHVVPHQRKAAR